MKKLVIGLIGLAVVLIWGCISKPTSQPSQNVVPEESQTWTVVKQQTGSTDESSTWEQQSSQTVGDDSSSSSVSPEEEKLIEDILNSIFEN